MWGRGITVAGHVLWHVDVIYTPGIANTERYHYDYASKLEQLLGASAILSL